MILQGNMTEHIFSIIQYYGTEMQKQTQLEEGGTACLAELKRNYITAFRPRAILSQMEQEYIIHAVKPVKSFE